MKREGGKDGWVKRRERGIIQGVHEKAERATDRS